MSKCFNLPLAYDRECLIFSVTPAMWSSVILRTPSHIFMVVLFLWARLTGVVSLFPPFAIFVARAILLTSAWSGNLRNVVFLFNLYITSFETIRESKPSKINSSETSAFLHRYRSR